MIDVAGITAVAAILESANTAVINVFHDEVPNMFVLSGQRCLLMSPY